MEKRDLDVRVIEWLDVPEASQVPSSPELWLRLLKKLHSEEFIDWLPEDENPTEVLGVITGIGHMLAEMAESCITVEDAE